MQIQIKLALDADGFLRRECPNCEQEFKWHHGKSDGAPEDYAYPDLYWCPRCGQSALPNTWWTQEQLNYQREMAKRAAHGPIADQLQRAVRMPRNSLIKLDLKMGPKPDEPVPLVEPDDMNMIGPPCHPWEPVKVPEGLDGPFYCLLCGEAFAV